MALTKHAIRELYRTRSKRYDISANLYYLIGFREAKYRRQAIERLCLKPGDTVVEIGCGTGLNFGYVERVIGDAGRLIGVDLTEAMLDQAQARIDAHGWENVQLVQSDAADYEFPEQIDGVFSTFALTLVPEYEQVMERAARALVEGGRFVILDLKEPDSWPRWLVKLGILITRPFGVTEDLAERKPWVAMERIFRRTDLTEIYGGFTYMAVGER